MWPWKWGQGHQNLTTVFPSPNNASVQVWSKSIHWFRRQSADKRLRRRRRDPHQKQYVPPPKGCGGIKRSFLTNIAYQTHHFAFTWKLDFQPFDICAFNFPCATISINSYIASQIINGSSINGERKLLHDDLLGKMYRWFETTAFMEPWNSGEFDFSPCRVPVWSVYHTQLIMYYIRPLL